MKIAHVRERNAPAGTPWRLAAARNAAAEPMAWLDLEAARQALLVEDPRRAHNSPLFRQPITTLDDHLGRGLRIAALGEVVEGYAAAADDDEAILDARDLVVGPPILRPPSLRDFYAFEGHVRTMWERRGGTVPETWYRLPIFYFSNVSELRGPGEPVWCPAASSELDYELEVVALVDTPARDLPAERGEEAIGGYTVFNDWSARDLQREETTVRLGPAKGKDFASSIGPWLVTPDELADARRGHGYDLAMTASVNGQELSRGSWADIAFGFGQMVERASADVTLRPGELLGSGTVGTGCLLEIKDVSFGRWLQPGDQVTLHVERLGSLSSPVIERPGSR
ncbi:MAG TPA: fumarylacetoacetate hydrolase family protein [Candidatus Limnocylindria bacterium]|jgi:fumarylacetoacetate (FAA) hydrolase|nr:fumarylacetoacetate hydrolase family protein [Candidatus Limnocylindria bacterium]